MIQLIPKITAYQMFRQFGFPRLYPLNLTVSVTYRCNARCRTCNVYQKKVREFSLEEFEKTFESLGSHVFWLTLSGGEPFLRKDIVDICRSAYQNCRPKIINIATNGILSDFITESVERIVQNSPKSLIIVNLSVDEIGEKHDDIRGVKGNYKKALKTFRALNSLNYSNLTVGIHTVISRFNVHNFPRIFEELNRFQPDSYITEIAEQRVELGTMGEEIAPSLQEYVKAIDFLCERIKHRRYNGISALTQAFRLQYYDLAKEILKEKRQVLPCYAGFISAQIAPDGQIWACCIRAESMGDLRKAGYDFKRVWFSEKAQAVRKPIREKKCFCPLANASYTNMLLSFRTLASVLKNIAARRVKEHMTRA
ncbi:MAG: radical SAM/SPASM domain-containing protein [Candidatus Aminicenantes bacterium]